MQPDINKTASHFLKNFSSVKVENRADNKKVTILVPRVIKDDKEKVEEIFNLINDCANELNDSNVIELSQLINKFEKESFGKNIKYLSKIILDLLIAIYYEKLNFNDEKKIKKALSNSNKNKMCRRIEKVWNNTLPYYHFFKDFVIWTTAHYSIISFLNEEFFSERIDMLYPEQEIVLYYLMDIAEDIITKMKVKDMSISQIESLLGLRAPSYDPEYKKLIATVKNAIVSYLNKEFISIPSTFLYHGLLMAMFSKFENEEIWPKIKIENKRIGLLATASLIPHVAKVNPYLSDDDQYKLSKKMTEINQSMNEYTVDVLNALFSIFFSRKNNDEWLDIDADTILTFLGVKKKKSRVQNGVEVRGGFDENSREIISKQLELLSCFYLHIEEADLYTKEKRSNIKREGYLLEFQDTPLSNSNIYFWHIRPNQKIYESIVKNGKQFELLSKKILGLNHQKLTLEKRLSYYFSFIWRVNQKKNEYLRPMNTNTILSNINWVNNKSSIVENNLIEALNILKENDIITNWSADKNNTGSLLNGNIIIEPPETIVESYYDIAHKNPTFSEKNKLNALTYRTRKEKGYSYIETAEKIGISARTLQQFEKNIIVPNQEELGKIKHWLRNNVTRSKKS